MESITTSLREFLRNISVFDESLYLCLRKNTNFSSNEFCVLAELGGDVEEKLFSKGFKIILGIFDIVDIISNLKQQTSNPTDQQILDAIRFYYENDAFIEL
jgi:hypothetical protein